MLMATSIPGPFFSNRLFFVVDRVTNTCLLVDTGAEVSITPLLPDALSRMDINALSVTRVEVIYFEQMAATHQEDPDIKHLLACMGSQPCSFHIEPIPLQSSTNTLLCDVTTGVPRPLVPSILR